MPVSAPPRRLQGRWIGRAAVAGALIWAVSHPIVLAAWARGRDANIVYLLLVIGWLLSVLGLSAFWARYRGRLNLLARVGFAITAGCFALLPAVLVFAVFVAAGLGVGALLLGAGLTSAGLVPVAARVLFAPLPLGALAYVLAADSKAAWAVAVVSLSFAAVLAAFGEELGSPTTG